MMCYSFPTTLCIYWCCLAAIIYMHAWNARRNNSIAPIDNVRRQSFHAGNLVGWKQRVCRQQTTTRFLHLIQQRQIAGIILADSHDETLHHPRTRFLLLLLLRTHIQKGKQRNICVRTKEKTGGEVGGGCKKKKKRCWRRFHLSVRVAAVVARARVSRP